MSGSACLLHSLYAHRIKVTLKNNTNACSSSLIFEVWLHFVFVPICRARLSFCAVVHCFTSFIHSVSFFLSFYMVSSEMHPPVDSFSFYYNTLAKKKKFLNYIKNALVFTLRIFSLLFLQVHNKNLNETASRHTIFAILSSVYTGANS